MRLSDNIRRFRRLRDLSQEDIAKKLGYKSFTTIQKWETGMAEPPVGKLYELADILRVNIMELLGEESDNNITDMPISTYKFVPASVSAGALTNIDSINYMPSVIIPDFMMGRYAGNRNIILMHVNGESMNNVIQNGAVIAVLTNVDLSDIHDGDIVVIKNGGDYTVKRFYNDSPHQEFVFRPDSNNMAFRDIVFSYENTDDLYLIGKVVMYNVTLQEINKGDKQ
ncbi:XRE family transcriptional regulator [Veillonella atypica]|uniref:XRE family transcriptional regulator n=1 Tax=Veillonella atypica TaxID=39777 RepID=UPI001D061FDD|nr:XRE family transcriptional regulator [Veillonella atypica]MCB6770591.1 XRE family transcriptional regulator [Veillonella atypica]